MPWCPKCKTEYVEGIVSCSDCGAVLTKSLCEEEAQEEQVLLRSENECRDVEPEPVKEEEKVKAYQESAERARESKSSAWMLLVIGGIGFVAAALVFFNVIPLNLTVSSRYMTCGGMGAFFLLLFFMGVSSMRMSKKLELKAVKEKALTAEMKLWCNTHFSAKQLDAEITDMAEDEAEEIKYFKRAQLMKRKISDSFYDLEEDFLEYFIDENYTSIFGQDHSGI